MIYLKIIKTYSITKNINMKKFEIIKKKIQT